MSVQACVVLPLSEYESMEERVINPPKKEEKKKEETAEATPSDSDKEEAETEECVTPVKESTEKVDDNTDTGISQEVKTLVKKRSLSSVHFEKMLRAIQQYKGDDKLNLSNLSQLVRQACGKSTKKLPNEEDFYNYLIKHNLIHFVKNFKKLAQHFPYFMKV